MGTLLSSLNRAPQTIQCCISHPTYTVFLSVVAQLLQCSAANQSVLYQLPTLQNCQAVLPHSHPTPITHNMWLIDNLQTSTKHLSNLGYEDYPYRQINVTTHHWTNNTANSLYGQLAPCNNNNNDDYKSSYSSPTSLPTQCVTQHQQNKGTACTINQ
jgi:hypothetical protein